MSVARFHPFTKAARTTTTWCVSRSNSCIDTRHFKKINPTCAESGVGRRSGAVCVKSAHLLAEARLSTVISIGTECALRLSQPEARAHGRGFQVAEAIDPERSSTLRDGRRGFEDSETPLASRVLG